MSEKATYRINLKTGEIEISGSEEFVNSKIESISDIINLFSSAVEEEQVVAPAEVEAKEVAEKPTPVAVEAPQAMPESFGEWMHQFSDDVNDLEKGLINAQFVQTQSATNDFKTAEVNKSLKDHGIKLSNASLTLNRLVSKKYLFKTRKVGSLKYFRVTTDGQKHLNTLKREG